MLQRIRTALIDSAASALGLKPVEGPGTPAAKARRLAPVVLALTLVLTAAAFWAIPGQTARGPIYHSPLDVVISPDGKVLYVTNRTADSVVEMDRATGEVKRTVSVPEPTALALSPSGDRLYVASVPQDRLYEINLTTGKICGSLGVGRQPIDIVLSTDGSQLFCLNQFTDDVSLIDVAQMTETRRLKAIREPRFAALTPDEKTLVVANHLPVGSNLDETMGACVSIIDLASGDRADVQLSRGATDVGEVRISQDGKYAYLVHVLARWLIPPTQLERGWVATTALTIVDIPEKKRVDTVLLDDLDRGAAGAHGLAMSPDGKQLFVTHSGVNEVQIIDVVGLHELLAGDPEKREVDLENDLTAVYRSGCRKRVKCGGIGPRGIAADANGVFVANYYSGTITQLTTDRGKVTATWPLGEQPEMDMTRKGEMLFNDAIICFQGWQSCATCHPDGRVDALAWDLLNDGIGNPKNAKSLLLSAQTPPSMGTGVRDTMEAAVAAGLKFILFHVPTEEEIAAISEYCRTMKPARSPFRNVDGSLSEAALRGKEIFERDDVACARCHPAPLFTDLKTYDVGTRHEFDRRGEFDTPTLVEMFRSAPFLHDGSAVTMREVLVEHNMKDQHGKTSHLSEQEIDDLAEYILSL